MNFCQRCRACHLCYRPRDHRRMLHTNITGWVQAGTMDQTCRLAAAREAMVQTAQVITIGVADGPASECSDLTDAAADWWCPPFPRRRRVRGLSRQTGWRLRCCRSSAFKRSCARSVSNPPGRGCLQSHRLRQGCRSLISNQQSIGSMERAAETVGCAGAAPYGYGYANGLTVLWSIT